MQGKSLVTQQVRQMNNLPTSRVHKYSEDLYFSQANFVRMGYVCMWITLLGVKFCSFVNCVCAQCMQIEANGICLEVN